MAFLKVKAENVAKEGGSSYANTSGIYDVNMKACEIASTTNGATQANYMTDKCMSYGNTLADRNGKPIFGMAIIESLAAVLGQDELSDPEATDVKFKKATKELMCIPELTDVDVKMWVQFEYRFYKGVIQESVNAKRFYRASDGASGSEVLAEAQAAQDGIPVATNRVVGTQLAKDTAYSKEVKYSDSSKGAGDAPTEAQVIAWKKAQAGGTPDAAAATVNPKGAIKGFPKSA